MKKNIGMVPRLVFACGFLFTLGLIYRDSRHVDPAWVSGQGKQVVSDAMDDFCRELPGPVSCREQRLSGKNHWIMSASFGQYQAPAVTVVDEIVKRQGWLYHGATRQGAVYCKDGCSFSYEVVDGDLKFVTIMSGARKCLT